MTFDTQIKVDWQTENVCVYLSDLNQNELMTGEYFVLKSANNETELYSQ